MTDSGVGTFALPSIPDLDFSRRQRFLKGSWNSSTDQSTFRVDTLRNAHKVWVSDLFKIIYLLTLLYKTTECLHKCPSSHFFLIWKKENAFHPKLLFFCLKKVKNCEIKRWVAYKIFTKEVWFCSVFSRILRNIFSYKPALSKIDTSAMHLFISITIYFAFSSIRRYSSYHHKIWFSCIKVKGRRNGSFLEKKQELRGSTTNAFARSAWRCLLPRQGEPPHHIQ